MTTLPPLALSVRQPWAWAIIHAGKDIENRTAYPLGFFENLKGRRAIHAAKGLTQNEYEDARAFMAAIGVTCPAPAELVRGAIIGSVDVVDCVMRSTSPWFTGRSGLVLSNPQPCPPIPAVGQLGYFRWQIAFADIIPAPAQWMLRWQRDGGGGDLFK